MSATLNILSIIIRMNPANPATEGGKPASSWCRSQARINGEGWWQEGHPTIKLLPEPIWPVKTGQKHRPHIRWYGEEEEEEDVDHIISTFQLHELHL